MVLIIVYIQSYWASMALVFFFFFFFFLALYGTRLTFAFLFIILPFVMLYGHAGFDD